MTDANSMGRSAAAARNNPHCKPLIPLLAVALCAGAAHAQLLEEVVVTAQKIEQSAQDVGLTMSIFSGDDLEQQRIFSLDDLVQRTVNTGFLDTGGGGVPIVIIRGVGLQNFRVNDTPTTAFYNDEVYQTSIAMAEFEMFDLDRVEMLRGPQGGLYGRNALGGAINVVSRRPSYDEQDNYVKFAFGQYNRAEIEAGIGGATDKSAFRVSGRVVRSDDTQYRSVTGDFDHGEEDKYALRGQASFQLGEDTDLYLKLYGGKDQSETPLLRSAGIYQFLGPNIFPALANGALFNLGGLNPGAFAICSAIRGGARDANACQTIAGSTPASQGLLPEERFDSLSNFENRLDNSWWGGTMIIDHSFGSSKLVSITGYNKFDHGRRIDNDATQFVMQHIDYNSYITAWSQEFRLQSEGDGDLYWLVGASYGEDDLEENTLITANAGILPLLFMGAMAADQPYDQSTDALSIFGRVDWDISDSLSLIAEGRYTDESKTFVGGARLTALGIFISFTDDEYSLSEFSGKLGLEWRSSEDLLLYGNISRGFKSGGFFGGFATTSAQLLPYNEETIVAYEAGFKNEWQDAGIRLNGALFFYDRQDVQAAAVDPAAIIPIQQLTNVGDGEAKGGEVDLSWYATENFLLQWSVGYTDLELTDSDLVVPDIYNSGIFPLQGARLPNQPEWSSVVTARYEQDLSSALRGAIQFEYSHRSEQDLSMIVSPNEIPVLREDSYQIANLRISLFSDDSGWEIMGWVDNLFDEEYRTVARPDTSGGVYDLYGAPRIWGISGTYRF